MHYKIYNKRTGLYWCESEHEWDKSWYGFGHNYEAPITYYKDVNYAITQVEVMVKFGANPKDLEIIETTERHSPCKIRWVK